MDKKTERKLRKLFDEVLDLYIERVHGSTLEVEHDVWNRFDRIISDSNAKAAKRKSKGGLVISCVRK